MSTIMKILLASLFVSAITGCAKPVFNVVNPKTSAPAADKALVYFMRPRRFEAFTGGGNLYAKLYDGDTFLGDVPAKYQLAYQATPGKHVFMVTGSAADFLQAELEAGKKYYVVIEPRPGFDGLSFVMRPQNGQIDQQRLDTWHQVMRQIEPNEYGLTLAQQNEEKRKALKERYYNQWLQKPERPTLRKAAGL